MIDGINPIYATGYLKLDDCLYIFFILTPVLFLVCLSNKPNN